MPPELPIEVLREEFGRPTPNIPVPPEMSPRSIPDIPADIFLKGPAPAPPREIGYIPPPIPNIPAPEIRARDLTKLAKKTAKIPIPSGEVVEEAKVSDISFDPFEKDPSGLIQLRYVQELKGKDYQRIMAESKDEVVQAIWKALPPAYKNPKRGKGDIIKRINKAFSDYYARQGSR